ncbi:hypothetical protein [Flexithrix dorotheae]|uniref:hypothetical protein n=1 Tax=Flexithrix dorotheae TaxID=70993 RepID=UPI0003752A4D|nr:hypothetical protein [Flexithrix dorotheae]
MKILQIALIIGISYSCLDSKRRKKAIVKEKMEFINQSLHNQKATYDRSELLNFIENFNDELLSQKAIKIYDFTSETLEYLENFKSELIEYAGGYDSLGRILNTFEVEKQMEFTIGKNEDGEGYNLMKNLEKFTESVNHLDSTFNYKLVYHGNEFEVLSNSEAEKADFVSLNFENTPLVTALAIISQFETQVKLIESDAISRLKKLDK